MVNHLQIIYNRALAVFRAIFQATFSYDAELRAAELPARPHAGLEVVDVVGRPALKNPLFLHGS